MNDKDFSILSNGVYTPYFVFYLTFFEICSTKKFLLLLMNLLFVLFFKLFLFYMS